jgi:branched-chain amino acid transport system permease protein
VTRARAQRIAVVFGPPIVLLLLASLFIAPTPVLLEAAVLGLPNALMAVGIVLVYRSSRIINFSHTAVATAAATLFMFLLIAWQWSWWLALGTAVVAAIATGMLVELLLIRRFVQAPRLVLTVLTLGVAQVLAGVTGQMPQWFGYRLRADPPDPLPANPVVSPFTHLRHLWSPLVFRGDHLVAVVIPVILLAAIFLFFRRSTLGIAIRGAAENNDRAAMVGIDTGTLSTVVWMAAGGLAAFAAILVLPLQSTSLPAITAGIGVGSAGLLRALAASVVAKMEDLPLAISAAITISVFERAVFWKVSQTALVDAALFLAIVVALLLQRRSLARTEESATGSWAASEEIRAVPRELARLPSVRRGRRVVFVVGAILVLGYPWVMSPSQTNLGGLYAIYGIIAVSLVVLTGWGGQISLGQFAFAAFGAIIGGALTRKLGLPFLLAVPLAGVAGAGLAIAIGLPALRIRGLFLAVTTMAFAVTTKTVLLNERFFGWLLPGKVTRPKLLFVNTEDERAYYYLCLVMLALAVLIAQGLRRTRTGRVLIAMRDNERGAQSFGISLMRTRLATFAIAGFLAAVAGALYAFHQHEVSPNAFLPEQSIQMFLMAVIGGLGSVSGVLLGAIFLGTAGIVIGGTAGQLLTGGLGVIIVLVLFPGGLGSLAYSLRDAWLRRIAIRDRILVPSILGDWRLLEGDRARVPLAPKRDGAGTTADVPVHYELPSRVRVAGASQQSRGWRLM